MRLLWDDSDSDSDLETICVTDTPRSDVADPSEIDSHESSPQAINNAVERGTLALSEPPGISPFASAENFGMVVALELHNFKSYRGTVRICEFKKFTAIIGPNGCGKSNLMDAISFVLCVSSTVLRGLNSKDLIYKPGDASAEPVAEAYVALTLNGATRHVVFKRHISHAGAVTYFVDATSVSFKQYKESLREYRINTLGSTGLIFQGAVNDIASRSPVELTRLFETISGSSLYAKPYSYIKEKLERKRVECRDLASRKRTLQQELRQYRSMVTKGIDYDEVLSQYKRAEARKHACEFRLHEVKFSAHKSEYLQLCQRAAELNERWSTMQAKRDELERQRAALYFEQGQLHRTIQDKQRAVLSKKESMSEYYEQKSSLEQRISEFDSLRQSIEKDVDNLRREHEELCSQENQLCDDIDVLTAELEGLSTTLSLTPAQRQKYESLLQSFNKITSSLRVKLNIGRGKLTALSSDADNIRAELDLLNKYHAKLVEAAKPHAGMYDSLCTRLRETQDSLELLSMTQSRLEHERSQVSSRRAALQEEKTALDENLKTLNVAKVEYRQILRRRNYTQELVSAIPGVHGEVISLCEITNACYHDGIMAALNTRSHMIVTDDMSAIKACIKKLCSDRVHKRDFLPLDSLKQSKLDHRKRISDLLRMRGVRVQYTFAIDCLVFQRQYGSLFEHLVGDTVVVQSLDDAEVLISADMGHSMSFNVVTQKGQVITRDRTIILDSAVYTKKSHLELELAEFGRLTLKSERLDQDIHVLTKKLTGIENELQDTIGRIQKHRRAAELLKMKVDFAQRQKQASDQQLRNSETKLGAVRLRLSAAQDEVDKMRAELAKDEAVLLGLQQNHFEDLNEELGVDVYGVMNSRQDSAVRVESYLERKRALLTRCERDKVEIENRIEDLRESVLADVVAQHQSALAELHALLKGNQSLYRELDELESDLGKDREKFDSLSREIEKCHERIKFVQYDCDYGIDNADPSQGDTTTDVDDATGGDIVMLSEDDGYVAGPRDNGRNATTGRVVPLSESKEAVAAQLLSLVGTMRDLQRQAIKLVEECRLRNVECKIEVPESLVTTSSDFVPDFPRLVNTDLIEGVASSESGLEDFIKRLEDQMHSLRKSLGASRACDDAEVRLKRTQVDIDHLDTEMASAKSECTSLESDFERIKKERTSLFMNCFQSVKALVGPIYRSLSARDDTDEMSGGSAFLTLDDDVSGSVSEPFLCSIRYNTMPPMKKFLDLSLQSGGERAVSSLALLLALHSFRRSPFVVFDEIDANLDNVKVHSLVSFLQRSAFQVIIISLKAPLFSRADMLVGVYSRHESASSNCVVLNLEEYGCSSEGDSAIAANGTVL
ncbi:structural maintenance of chromosome 1-like protein, putative [Babesia bigemina]|uniref:Structural maintenance of chromosomes protein n=1 Tax=Babesia bigemina TaxID=5866 RepID=A0A061D7D2_BABBI|nr:structural maintenance of chromosome 1-like protein, putative [Babesia bigemina]CDR95887.1 structural maintenance of chromosome 1-like protein, putative [Babesia bigemina]|eukprot:XP_012768073.1 structural maintenance of chromosome 1-like protein, putative [Babesia bigemina]